MITVNLAQPSDLVQVQSLLSEYEARIDLSSDDLARETVNLPGEYTPPNGCILLAKDGADAVGCVAVRRMSEDVCEMMRLYVKPAFREEGIGRKLTESAIEEARARGYRIMKLSILPSMNESRRLCESLGFRKTTPYGPNPVKGAMFMLLDITASP